MKPIRILTLIVVCAPLVLGAASLARAGQGKTPAQAEGAAEAGEWRADTPVPSLDRATVLAQAPDPASDAGLFRVPKVL